MLSLDCLCLSSHLNRRCASESSLLPPLRLTHTQYLSECIAFLASANHLHILLTFYICCINAHHATSPSSSSSWSCIMPDHLSQQAAPFFISASSLSSRGLDVYSRTPMCQWLFASSPWPDNKSASLFACSRSSARLISRHALC